MQNGRFEYDYYESLMRLFAEKGYKPLFFTDSGYGLKGKLYLRHDLDFYPHGAMRMAEIERTNGMVSTWCFLTDSPLYNLCSDGIVRLVTELTDMGHQCCMHVNAAAYDGFEQLCEGVENNFRFFSSFLPLFRAISFHRPLPQMLDDMVVSGFAGAYEKRFFADITYVSDSNRRVFWKEDRLRSALDRNDSVQLLTHPMWWAEREIDEFAASGRVLEVAAATVEDTLTNDCKFFRQLREKGE